MRILHKVECCLLNYSMNELCCTIYWIGASFIVVDVFDCSCCCRYHRRTFNRAMSYGSIESHIYYSDVDILWCSPMLFLCRGHEQALFLIFYRSIQSESSDDLIKCGRTYHERKKKPKKHNKNEFTRLSGENIHKMMELEAFIILWGERNQI